MTSTRLAGVGAAVAAAIVLFGVIVQPVSAGAPYTAYGVGQKPGAMIAASVGGASCGPAVVVSAQGNWLMSIAETAPCAPKEGDIISFTVDGQLADQTVIWTQGGAPADASRGIALTVTVKAPTATAGIFSGGMIAPSGTSLVAFTGSTEQLNTAGAAVKAVSVSATLSGKLLTFVVGAPSFVNTEFNAAFPTGLAGTLVIVKT
ncbi:MAG: hypothetical protein C4558_05985 [Dehalococcoidia bacterium]|nr:MAG: hypothetical protein C4558_05985 [Dehalococcoidia bacterium]